MKITYNKSVAVGILEIFLFFAALNACGVFKGFLTFGLVNLAIYCVSKIVDNPK